MNGNIKGILERNSAEIDGGEERERGSITKRQRKELRNEIIRMNFYSMRCDTADVMEKKSTNIFVFFEQPKQSGSKRECEESGRERERVADEAKRIKRLTWRVRSTNGNKKVA